MIFNTIRRCHRALPKRVCTSNITNRSQHTNIHKSSHNNNNTTNPTVNSHTNNSAPFTAPPNAVVTPSPSWPTLPDGHPDYLRMILNARVYDVAIESPLQYASSLSARMGCNITLKREDLQAVFSFKIRGAYNKIANLSQHEKQHGVITCSAGNHAQGVALAAKKLGLNNTIVMPISTPSIKVNAVKQLGGNVLLYGDDFDSARNECERIASVTGQTLCHPFDDPYVIAGQGTIGMEIIKQADKLLHPSIESPPIDYIFCGVGGGGLIAGVAAYCKSVRPDIKIVAVETVDANALETSLRTNTRVLLPEVGLFADGAAVRQVGAENYRLCRELIDDIILVTNDDVCAAIRDCFNDTRSIMEPAGALGVAGVKQYIKQNNLYGSKKSFAAITSGANMSFARLRWVSDRGESVDPLPGALSDVLLAVTIPEQPGSFYKLIQTIHPRNMTEFSYRYSHPDNAHIFLAFQTADRSEVPTLIDTLQSQGIKSIDISEDDLARSHMRYLAGGRANKQPQYERVYRFQFPERPGALLKFLDMLQSTRGLNNTPWNVSMFHYRNYGGDVASVLAGIQVHPDEYQQWDKFLQTLNYAYHEETDNALYQLFLE